MTDVAIRLLTEADAPAFLALRQRSLREHPDSYHSSPEDWDVPVSQAAARITRNVVVGAFAGDTLVGCAVLALEPRTSAKLRHKAEVWNVYLAPEHRGSGLARCIMERVVAEARRLGLEAIVLGVAAHNARARGLYESLGFVTWGIEPRAMRLPSGEVLDDCFMQLDL